MQSLTLICIVLLAAVLWIAFVTGMLSHLARSERRAGLRAPRKSADTSGRRHGNGTRRRPKVRHRPMRRPFMHRLTR